MNVRAAVLYEVKRGPVVEEITLDDPQQGEVLVKMAATGICHTDLHVIKGDTPNLLPVVMGHEGAGIVEKVGPGVTAVQPGDHVVLLAISPCGTCRYCVEGQPALCQSTVLSNFSGSLYNG
ncbi:MAG: alcohol dehydrogenase, partial [Chloroflexi bacterium]|nr:alcohol dehydrogenase [Chloroflexota bacterium]